jgi:hypothetical protein
VSAQDRTDKLNRDGGTVEQRLVLQNDLRERIGSLQRRLDRLRDLQRRPDRLREVDGALRAECEGLLASAHKRHAELLFGLSRADAARADAWRSDSKAAIEASLAHYAATFRLDVKMHWQGIQQLALQAVLTGKVDPDDWFAVVYAAKRDRDGNPKDPWPLGTLAEAHLLAHLVGRPPAVADARADLEQFLERVKPEEPASSFPVQSTRRQLLRYVDWWTNANGFFPGVKDVSNDAQELARLLG